MLMKKYSFLILFVFLSCVVSLFPQDSEVLMQDAQIRKSYTEIHNKAIDYINMLVMKSLFQEYGGEQFTLLATELMEGQDFEKVLSIVGKSGLDQNIEICKNINELKQITIDDVGVMSLKEEIDDGLEKAIALITKNDPTRNETIKRLRRKASGQISGYISLYNGQLAQRKDELKHAGYSTDNTVKENGDISENTPPTYTDEVEQSQPPQRYEPIMETGSSVSLVHVYIIIGVLLVLILIQFFMIQSLKKQHVEDNPFEPAGDGKAADYAKQLENLTLKQEGIDNELLSVRTEIDLIKEQLLKKHILSGSFDEGGEKVELENDSEEEDIFIEQTEDTPDFFETNIRYAARPEQDGSFLIRNLTHEQQEDSLFVLSISEDDPDTATLELVRDNEELHSKILEDIEEYLIPVCEFGEESPENATGVLQLMRGKVAKQGDRWRIVTKVDVTFE